MTVTQQLIKSQDFQQNYLCDSHLGQQKSFVPLPGNGSHRDNFGESLDILSAVKSHSWVSLLAINFKSIGLRVKKLKKCIKTRA
jgi:hypothetical protein